MDSKLRIEPLADHPQTIPILVEWFKVEWEPYYGPGGPGDAAQDLNACCNRDGLPIAFVAFSGETLCGTAALKSESVTTHQHLTPWLAALLVAPPFRRTDVAERLIAAVEEKARRSGFRHLYVGTGEGSGTPEAVLHKRDWRLMERVPYFVSEVSIMQKALFVEPDTFAK